MRIKNSIRAFARDKTSEGYSDVAVSMLILIVFVVSLMAVVPIFTTQIYLNNTVQRVTRVVELTGQADSATINYALEGCYRPDDIDVDADYYNASTKTIQLKNRFIVNAKKQIQIVIIRPALGNPVGFNVNVGASATGISEVYWK